ncbi:MAG: hypothetical protein AAB425_14505 [Bdellovibrionota bacterium]
MAVKIFTRFFRIIPLILAVSCATPETAPTPLRLVESLSSGYEMIVIAGLNDFHGNLTDSTPRLVAQLHQNRKKFGDRFLVFSSGDFLHGDPASDLDEGFQATAIFNRIGVDAAMLAENDFAFGALGAEHILKPDADPIGALRVRLSEAQFPIVGTNLTGGSQLGIRPSLLLRAGAAKIGVLAVLDPAMIPYAPAAKLSGIAWSEPKPALLAEADRLRKEERVDAIVLLAHLSETCPPARKKRQRAFAPTDPLPDCDPRMPLANLLRSLPLGTIDAVVAGHEHQRIHHWIAGLPVIQSNPYGSEAALLYLTIDTARHAVLQ